MARRNAMAAPLVTPAAMPSGLAHSGTDATRPAPSAAGDRSFPCGEGHSAALFVDCSAERAGCERELLDAGLALPLPHRSVWAAAHPDRQSWFLAVRDPAGRPAAGCALEVTTSRALPGHRVLRVEKFGPALTAGARMALIRALAQVARREPRVLRVHLEVCARDARVRDQVAEAARACGFRPEPLPRMYTDTIVVDLTRDEEAMLASLGQKTRRNIREVAKHEFAVRPIVDPAAAPRMRDLLRETMTRTGGGGGDEDWKAIVTLAASHPALARVVGTVRTDVADREALVAFSWARSHGDHIEVCATASTRLPGSRVGLTYPLVWDLMCWGAAIGATWMDMGGVTVGGHGGADPLGGISDFKRSFSKTVVRVGDEWVFEPSRGRAWLANLVGGAWSWLHRR